MGNDCMYQQTSNNVVLSYPCSALFVRKNEEANVIGTSE